MKIKDSIHALASFWDLDYSKLKDYDNKIKDIKEEEISSVMKEIFDNSELNL